MLGFGFVSQRTVTCLLLGPLTTRRLGREGNLARDNGAETTPVALAKRVGTGHDAVGSANLEPLGCEANRGFLHEEPSDRSIERR